MSMIPSEGEEEIHPPSLRKTQEWITTLAAAGIPFRLILVEFRWVILVSREAADAARREIEIFEEVNKDWPPQPKPRYREPAAYRTWAGFWGVYLLLLFSIWMGPYDSHVALGAAGAADAQRIVAGEWWRVATALMLHSGVVHLTANVVFLLFFSQGVCGRMGPGLGWFLIIASGLGGNLASAFLLRPDFVSVGASTAGFGAVGILSVVQAVENFRRFRIWRSVWSRAWIPLGAGLALLGLTGVGEHSDLAAHAFGLVAGMLMALPPSLAGTAWLSKWGQRLLAGACLAFMACAWWVAWIAAG